MAPTLTPGRTYRIREVFGTLQGEGARAGAKSVFVRFTGCNLWNGRPEDRHKGKGACAQWCDTDFATGEPLHAEALLLQMNTSWGSAPGPKWCVISGGEPTLQLDVELVDFLHFHDWLIAVETNGSTDAQDVLRAVDWVTVSPKRGGGLKQTWGHELKLVLPGGADPLGVDGWSAHDIEAFEKSTLFSHYFVQPQDPIDPQLVQVSHLHDNIGSLEPAIYSTSYDRNLRRCLDLVEQRPRWRLSLQTHKMINLP